MKPIQKTTEKKVVRRIQERDIGILYTLYLHRAMTTDQIREHFNFSKHYAYRKLYILRNSELIISHTIKHTDGIGRGSFHRITEKGITTLREHGYEAGKTANELRVDKFYLPYLLSANEMMISLTPYGWKMMDSRVVKAKYELNRSDSVQGMLVTPYNKKYAIYIFMRSTSYKNLKRILQDLDKNKLDNIILFTKGESSFLDIVNYCTKNKITKGGSLKVLPYGFGKQYLIALENENNFISFMRTIGLPIELNSKTFKREGIFRYLTTHNGEEKYVIDLLDTDLMKIHDIKQYRNEHYQLDGRKLLILTYRKSYHADLIGDMKHVDYVEINPTNVTEFANKLPKENVFK